MVSAASGDSYLLLLVLSVTDKNWNIELKLDGDFRLVSQISIHFFVSRFNCFKFCKQANLKNKKKQKNTETAKNTVLENYVFSPVPNPIGLKLGGYIQVSTRNSVVCLFCLYYCLLTFCKHKQTKHTLCIIWSSEGQMF